MKIIRTNSENKDFIDLVKLLDADLAQRDGEDHSFYAQFNKIDTIKHAVVLYENDIPLACGAIKEFDTDSIINEFGTHGGEFSDKSISNEFCNYGGEFSDLSPYNQFTQTPPKLIKDEQLIAYVTKNEFLSPSIDPDILLALTKREAI